MNAVLTEAEIEESKVWAIDRLRMSLSRQAGETREQMREALKQNGVPMGKLASFLNGDDDALGWDHIALIVQWVRGNFCMISTEQGWILRPSRTAPAVALGTRAPTVQQGKRYEPGQSPAQAKVVREASGKDLPSGSVEEMKRRKAIEAEQAELAERKKKSEAKPLFGLGWR